MAQFLIKVLKNLLNSNLEIHSQCGLGYAKSDPPRFPRLSRDPQISQYRPRLGVNQPSSNKNHERQRQSKSRARKCVVG